MVVGVVVRMGVGRRKKEGAWWKKLSYYGCVRQPSVVWVGCLWEQRLRRGSLLTAECGRANGPDERRWVKKAAAGGQVKVCGVGSDGLGSVGELVRKLLYCSSLHQESEPGAVWNASGGEVGPGTRSEARRKEECR